MSTATGISKTGVVIALVVAGAVAVGAYALLKIDWTGGKGNRLGPAYNYDLTDLRKTDPRLVLYRQTGTIKTGMERPRAIAVGPDGRIYLAGDKSVRIVARAAASGPSQPANDVRLEAPPHCLTVAADGTIYVGMKDHVEVYDPAGRRQAKWDGLGGKAILTSIAAFKDNVFVADAGNRIVLRYDLAGKIVNRIGQKDADKDIPGFIVPSPFFDLAAAPDGLLRVADPGRHRIAAYTFDGHLELTWGRFSTEIDGFCGCCNPANFAILPDGQFVTAEKGLTRVKVYSGEGKFVGVVAGADFFGRQGETSFGSADEAVLDVAAGPDGAVLVLDPAIGAVRVFQRMGKP